MGQGVLVLISGEIRPALRVALLQDQPADSARLNLPNNYCGPTHAFRMTELQCGPGQWASSGGNRSGVNNEARAHEAGRFIQRSVRLGSESTPDLGCANVPISAIMSSNKTGARSVHQAASPSLWSSSRACRCWSANRQSRTGAVIPRCSPRIAHFHARAGTALASEQRATTHWAWFDQLPLLGVIPVRERVVRDGNRITGPTVSQAAVKLEIPPHLAPDQS